MFTHLWGWGTGAHKYPPLLPPPSPAPLTILKQGHNGFLSKEAIGLRLRRSDREEERTGQFIAQESHA